MNSVIIWSRYNNQTVNKNATVAEKICDAVHYVEIPLAVVTPEKHEKCQNDMHIALMCTRINIVAKLLNLLCYSHKSIYW